MVPTFFEVRIGMYGVKKGRSVNRGIDQGRAFNMELPQKNLRLVARVEGE